jgi:hypothetical protein
MREKEYFYIPEERTYARWDVTDEYYENAQIYRKGQWVKTLPANILCACRPCSKEEAIKEIGEEAVNRES